jgi:hypothetical protein
VEEPEMALLTMLQSMDNLASMVEIQEVIMVLDPTEMELAMEGTLTTLVVELDFLQALMVQQMHQHLMLEDSGRDTEGQSWQAHKVVLVVVELDQILTTIGTKVVVVATLEVHKHLTLVKEAVAVHTLLQTSKTKLF